MTDLEKIIKAIKSDSQNQNYTENGIDPFGCKQYSIGSDGHIPEHFCYEFDRLQCLLKDYQIDENHLI